MLLTRLIIFFFVSLGAMLSLGLADPDAVDAPSRTLIALGIGLFCALFWERIERASWVWDFVEDVTKSR